MKKTLAVGATTLTLLFGGAGVATASTLEAPATITLAQAQEHEDDGGDNGLWGLAGLLGLVGLAGLMRRKNADYPANRAGGTITNNPRA
jgi:MYXO-CTERM domain-containing protein